MLQRMRGTVQAPASYQPHDYWQSLLPPDAFSNPPEPPFVDQYPVRLPDGRWLVLPIRLLTSEHDRAIASLTVNQASFEVEHALIKAMADIAIGFPPATVVGVVTLGLSLARGVAIELGHQRYVALGQSRKFWYVDELSEPVRSITSPLGGKSIFIDPRMLPLVQGEPVLIVDDVVSTGGSAAATLRLMRKIGARPIGFVVAMMQTNRWRQAIAEIDGSLPALFRGLFQTPVFRRVAGGWEPIPESVDF